VGETEASREIEGGEKWKLSTKQIVRDLQTPPPQHHKQSI